MDKTAEKPPKEEPFFSWSANLLVVNRRRAVVVINDSNRFGFVLYGIRPRDFDRLSEMITAGIYRCLREEGIREAVIDAYLKAAGPLRFSKTAGRTQTARLVKACERVEIFAERLNKDVIYQPEMTHVVNGDLYRPEKNLDYTYPYVSLLADFEAFYGTPVVELTAVELLISLDLEVYTAIRRLTVPLMVSFRELHKIIQIAYDWRDQHLHDFDLMEPGGSYFLRIISELDDVDQGGGPPTAYEKNVSLGEVIEHLEKIFYTYDFGDNWRHEITVLGIRGDYDKNYPVCTLAEGNRPPEDVGGVGGYREFLEIMNNPDCPEYPETKAWLANQWYRELDMEVINRRLRHVLY